MEEKTTRLEFSSQVGLHLDPAVLQRAPQEGIGPSGKCLKQEPVPQGRAETEREIIGVALQRPGEVQPPPY